ncbi:Zinc finger CCCH domain-containing protein 27 [Rhynchospora pubera]|uniref:Zinc finger CCCH domain-containing protein 27 n=1 Tax=Rhynchospora pubera TaxID=906938 RepID=A0AAV8FCX0_9POAL|nr:Zinc finger CCCH domain-containing protein 27 [Rhynchospora pubera]
MINQSVSPSKEEYISVNNISDDSAMDSEENEITDEDDEDRNHKHRRRDSSRLPVSNENNTPAEEPSTVQQSKKRVRPFEHSSKFDKRRFRSNNLFHGRGRGRNNNNNNNHSHPVNWAPPHLEMHDLALMASSHGANGSWPGYGFVPGIGTGIIEAMHHPCPMGPGMVGPAMMELGLPRQRCPDFEELGYCLRGDMCPLEHGVNRIVVDDVQSLSQLKLLQPDPVPKPVTLKDPLRPNGVLASVITAPDSDVYDPDQPLWNTNSQPVASPNRNSAGTATGAGTNDLSYHPDSGPSVWGRIGKTNKSHGQKEYKNKLDNMHEDSTGASNTGIGRQRASRTLYICGIPQKDNRHEALFSHFKKFGRVIDIYIPSNSEKAFVQFSKREEAEAALVAPDAVMGNRFIKVLWANRDRFSDEAGTTGYQPKPLPHLSQAPVSHLGKGGNLVNLPGSDTKGTVGSSSAEAVAMTPKVPPVNVPKVGMQKSEGELESSAQKKLEEIRKKQEELARKRAEFKRKLQMFEKQGSVGKRGENSPITNKTDAASESPKPATITQKNGNMMPHESLHTATEKRISKDRIIGPPNVRVNRFKIDNRPVQFLILPPLPDEISDVSILKEHFSSFGEVASLEVDKRGAENEKETEARVTYTTHEEAEKAYTSGRSLRNHNLIFKWVPALNSNAKANGNNAGAVPHENSKPVAFVSCSPSSPARTELERSASPAGGPMEPVERKDRLTDLRDGSTSDRTGDASVTNSGTVED